MYVILCKDLKDYDDERKQSIKTCNNIKHVLGIMRLGEV